MQRILASLVLLFLLLGGCQTLPRSDTQDTANGPEHEKKLPQKTVATYSRSESPHSPEGSTVVALLGTAGKQASAGDTVSARRTLERALRIEPHNARLWNELAHIYHQEKQYSKAANTAAKSNSLAGSNRTLKHDNWKLIASARRKSGDLAGARAADRMADRYQATPE